MRRVATSAIATSVIAAAVLFGTALAVAALVVLPTTGAHAQPPFVGGEVDQDAILATLTERYPLRVRQVGTSSVTLRLDLSGGTSAAFKPRTGSHPRGYRAEVAAYRIARALGMDNVPPAIVRRLPRPTLEARFDGDGPAAWEGIRQEIRWDAPGVARGAMIYWVPQLRRSELDTVDGVDAVAGWLRAGEPVPDDGRAPDLAAMLALDYLIGNWDRFSGGNVSQTDAGDRLYVRDHNIAFNEPFYDARYERVRAGLERVERLPRGFVTRLQALDEAALRAALAEDPEDAVRPILSDEQIQGVLARRRALLSYIAAQIALHGAERTLAWD